MDIAIIGVSLRLPNEINNLDDMHNILINKTDCLKEHPKERFNDKYYYDKDNNKGKFNTKYGGYLNNVYDFDNEFFKISKIEGKTMDPQQRIILELVYEALQDANIKLNDIKNTNTGVYIGSCGFEHLSNGYEDPYILNNFSLTGGLMTLISNRISYFYNLHGPSMTLDTACSSSGHALYNACQSIKNNVCDTCIVGGVNLILNPETTVGFSQGQFLSPEGKCKTFDDSANGYVRSEGSIIFIIKELNKALKDNNHIYGIINDVEVNQNGKSESIVKPNQKAQEDLLNNIYKDIDFEKLEFVECHGTGTKLGDYTECNALGNIIGKKKEDFLKIGSLKSNIGHTEASSGLASIAKVLCSMKNNILYPNIHLTKLSSNINFKDLNLDPILEAIPIDKEDYYMGINNYGFGGSNFHCLIENYHKTNEIIDEKETINNLHLLCIYGNNEESIDKNTYPFLEYEDDLFLKYLYNQNLSDKLDEAKIYVCKNKQDLEQIIFNEQENKISKIYGQFNSTQNKKPEICFVFCGQGPQYIDMGIEYMESFPVFKNKIIECDHIWKKITQFSFIEKYGMFIKNENIDYNTLPINDPIIAQPSLTFFQIALFELYKYFGVNPNIVLGHSAGEQVAFYASGALSLEDTIKISYYRSIYQQKTSGNGNMLVVVDNLEKVEELLEKDEKLELAAINSQNSFVLSGPTENIDQMIIYLNKNNIKCIKIRGNCPFHSSYQDIIKDDIINYTKNIRMKKTNIELISTVSGFIFDIEDYKNDYWWSNIRNTVRFEDAIEQCTNIDIFVEISPHPVLGYNISEINDNKLILQSGNKKENSSIIFLSSIAKLYLSGLTICLEHFGIKNNIYKKKYSWNKKELILKPKTTINRHHNKINKINEINFHINKFLYIKDHIIGDKNIFPTVGYIEIINKFILYNQQKNIVNLEINKMLLIENNEINFYVEKNNNVYELKYKDGNYINFELKVTENKINQLDKSYLLDSSIFYDKNQIINILKNKNFHFTNLFLDYDKAYITENEILLTLENENIIKNNENYPQIFDKCLTSSEIYEGFGSVNQYLPIYIEEINYINNTSIPKYIYSDISYINYYNIKIINSYILDENYNVLVEFKNIRAKLMKNDITTIYEPYLQKIELNKNKNEKIQNYIIINNVDLLKIRDKLLENKNNIYLINIENNYEIVGFIRSLINEIKEVNFKIIYHESNTENLKDVIKDVLFRDIEYFYENNDFYQEKIFKYEYKYNNNDNYYLHYTKKGNIDNLEFKNNYLNMLENNEVLVEIKYSSLNFKDIATIQGFIDNKNIGYEFSGVIIKSKSKKFKIGDEVFGIEPKNANAIANNIIISDTLIFNKPNNLNLLESSIIPICYGTAYLSLIKYANIKESDIVLIHSASGGLGLAAIEICNSIGCKIIVSAGNEEKRNYLKNKKNVVLVTDSRNKETYKKDILNYSESGVDVILSSTINEDLEINLELLKPCGKYLDVGKRQIYENHKLSLKHFYKSIQYISVHFDELLISSHNIIHQILNKVIKLFNSNKINPIKINEYLIKDYRKGFLKIIRSNHIGKIVFNMNDFKPNKCLISDIIFNKNKYYFISGGLGGLGLKLVKWMKINGATRFIISSRREINNKLYIKEFKDCHIIYIKTDLLDYDELDNLLKDYDIDGVFHLAGTFKDNLVTKLKEENINEILDIKIKGIQNLGKIFENRIHSYFVAFSSISCLIGNPGQSLYSAANSYMDRYCKKRKQKNLPALSIQLGAIDGCGMIHHQYNLARTMKNNGIHLLSFYDMFQEMKYCLIDNEISNVCITNQNWNELKELKTNYIFSNFINNENVLNQNNIQIKEKDFIIFIENLLDIKNIDYHKNLVYYGVDSIMSMEISNWCKDHININLKQIEILQGITIDEILQKINNTKIKLNTKENNINKFIFTTNKKKNK